MKTRGSALAAAGAGLGHDGLLGARVDEDLDGRAVDLGVDVEHDDARKGLGQVLDGVLHVLEDVLLTNRLLNALLALGGVGVDIHTWRGSETEDGEKKGRDGEERDHRKRRVRPERGAQRPHDGARGPEGSCPGEAGRCG